MTKCTLITALLAIMVCGCSKDKTDNRSDCQKNNYGILKVVYGSTTTRHRITAFLGFGYYEKVSEIGVSSDTLHVAPYTYDVHIASINSTGVDISSQNVPAAISQCNETSKTVNF